MPEQHIIARINTFMCGKFYLDREPPLSNLIYAQWVKILSGDFICDGQIPVSVLRDITTVVSTVTLGVGFLVMIQLGCRPWLALLGTFLLLSDTFVCSHLRTVNTETWFIFFILSTLYFYLKYQQSQKRNPNQTCLLWIFMTGIIMGFCISTRFTGMGVWCIILLSALRDCWNLLEKKELSLCFIGSQTIVVLICLLMIPCCVYTSLFIVHLSFLTKAGPDMHFMTSQFQAELKGGLSEIILAQPTEVAYGSQITLRPTHLLACWLYSNDSVYPLRYVNGRGSSHQQQVTCITQKDVNNWWIVKHPELSKLTVDRPPEVVRHGSTIQLVHGMTSRALNSHDVAAPITEDLQEVSCYIDYNVNMPAMNLWRIEIVNRASTEEIWSAVTSQISLVHVNTSHALKVSGEQVPDWGGYQYEVVADSLLDQQATIWNVEEHQYSHDNQEDIDPVKLKENKQGMSRWQKLYEYHSKMKQVRMEGWSDTVEISSPFDWPLAKCHVIKLKDGKWTEKQELAVNPVLWHSALLGLLMIFVLLLLYKIQEHRKCLKIRNDVWHKFGHRSILLSSCYLVLYLPHWFSEQSPYLQYYLPAFVVSILILIHSINHISEQLKSTLIQYIIPIWVALIFFSHIT